MDPSSDRDPVEELAEEFVGRYRRGERPPLSEYTDRHPQWADRIRALFPALLALERVRPDPADGPSGAGSAAGAARSMLSGQFAAGPPQTEAATGPVAEAPQPAGTGVHLPGQSGGSSLSETG